MPVSPDYLAWVCELLAPLGHIRSKRMFGGIGLYCDELFFAIVVDDVLYLKADAESRAAFEREALEPFSYEARGKRTVMNYFRAPDEALESPELMRCWGLLALGAALRAR